VRIAKQAYSIELNKFTQGKAAALADELSLADASKRAQQLQKAIAPSRGASVDSEQAAADLGASSDSGAASLPAVVSVMKGANEERAFLLGYAVTVAVDMQPEEYASTATGMANFGRLASGLRMAFLCGCVCSLRARLAWLQIALGRRLLS
jgi:hypothetical protein